MFAFHYRLLLFILIASASCAAHKRNPSSSEELLCPVGYIRVFPVDESTIPSWVLNPAGYKHDPSIRYFSGVSDYSATEKGARRQAQDEVRKNMSDIIGFTVHMEHVQETTEIRKADQISNPNISVKEKIKLTTESGGRKITIDTEYEYFLLQCRRKKDGLLSFKCWAIAGIKTDTVARLQYPEKHKKLRDRERKEALITLISEKIQYLLKQIHDDYKTWSLVSAKKGLGVEYRFNSCIKDDFQDLILVAFWKAYGKIHQEYPGVFWPLGDYERIREEVRWKNSRAVEGIVEITPSENTLPDAEILFTAYPGKGCRTIFFRISNPLSKRMFREEESILVEEDICGDPNRVSLKKTDSGIIIETCPFTSVRVENNFASGSFIIKTDQSGNYLVSPEKISWDQECDGKFSVKVSLVVNPEISDVYQEDRDVGKGKYYLKLDEKTRVIEEKIRDMLRRHNLEVVSQQQCDHEYEIVYTYYEYEQYGIKSMYMEAEISNSNRMNVKTFKASPIPFQMPHREYNQNRLVKMLEDFMKKEGYIDN